jgi:hypothetical protein
MHAVGQPHLGQHLHRLFARRRLRQPAHATRAELDVLECRHLRKQVELLEDHAGLLADHPLPRPAFAHADAVDDQVAAIDGLEHVDAPEQRRLAGTRWTDQHHDLALLDREVDLVEHRQGAEPLRDLPELDEAHSIRILFSVVRRTRDRVPVMIR